MFEWMRQAARPETLVSLAVFVFVFGTNHEVKLLVCVLIVLAILLSYLARHGTVMTIAWILVLAIGQIIRAVIAGKD